MKNKGFIFFIFTVAALFPTGCTQIPDNQAEIIIANQDTDSNKTIMAVYTDDDDDGKENWVCQWNGNAEYGELAAFYVTPGNYNIKIVTLYYILPSSYSTGYKSPVSCDDGDIKCITFDGKGIYLE
jgi:hypothetical protein